MGLVDRDIGHTELEVDGNSILISTKRINMRLALRDIPGVPESTLRHYEPYIETMILADESKYRFGGFQLKYEDYEEERAARRHRWLVWIVCELTGHPQPSRPSRFNLL